MTESTLKIWKVSRNSYLKFFNDYTLEQLNKIPIGFNNNLIWNLGHAIVTQQTLIYRLSGLPMYISDDLFKTYKNGSTPTGLTTQAEVDELKDLLISLVDKTLADVEKGVFQNYREFTTSTGFNVASNQDAFEFNNYHEALHLGYLMSIRKHL